MTSRYSKVMHRSRKNLAASDCIFAVKDFENAAELTGSHRFYTVGPLKPPTFDIQMNGIQ